MKSVGKGMWIVFFVLGGVVRAEVSLGLGKAAAQAGKEAIDDRAPDITLTASPPSVSFGGTTLLAWRALRGSACATSWGAVGLEGTYTTPPLTTATRYWVGCKGEEGLERKRDLTVSVLTSALPGATLLFQSGFGGSSVVKPTTNPQRDKIQGLDPDVPAPNDWVNDLENNPFIGSIAFYYEGGTPDQRHAKIIDEPNRLGNRVMEFVLAEANVLDGAGVPYKGRVQMVTSDNNGLKEVFFSVRLYLHPDVAELKTFPDSFSWLTLSEWWNNSGWDLDPYPFRITVNIRKPEPTVGSALRFGIHGQVKEPTTEKWTQELWEYINTEVEVPVGRWMTLEHYFKEGDAANGRFMMWVTTDGEAKRLVFDIHQITHHPDDPEPDGLGDINLIKIYTSKELIDHVRAAGKTLRFYWDDFKLAKW